MHNRTRPHAYTTHQYHHRWWFEVSPLRSGQKTVHGVATNKFQMKSNVYCIFSWTRLNHGGWPFYYAVDLAESPKFHIQSTVGNTSVKTADDIVNAVCHTHRVMRILTTFDFQNDGRWVIRTIFPSTDEVIATLKNISLFIMQSFFMAGQW